jgi:hypothetical protein
MPVEYITVKGEQVRKITRYPFDLWVVAIDPGGIADHTAIAALHFVYEPLVEGEDNFHVSPDRKTIKQNVRRTFRVHGLKRLPLGLTIPQQCDRLEEIILARPQLRRADVVFDAGGLGVGLLHAYEERGHKVAARIVFSAGNEIGKLKADRISVPKDQLIGALDGAVQNNELRGSPDLPEVEALFKGAGTFHRAITAAGRSTMNARESEHDDLICALSMSCWWAKRRQSNRLQVGGYLGAF